MSEKLSIQFGALAPSLSVQLKGCGVPRKDLNRFQRQAEAIVLLWLGGLIPDSVARSAQNKLAKSITAKCKRGNEPAGANHDR